MTRPRLATELAAGLALAVLVLAAAGRLGGPVHLATALGPSVGTAPFTAVAVLQADDCEGTVDFLRSFMARDMAKHYDIIAYVVGDAADRRLVQARLRERVGGVTVRAAVWRVIRALAATGHDTTPFVVVLDREGRLRLTSAGSEFFDRPGTTLGLLQQLAASLQPDGAP